MHVRPKLGELSTPGSGCVDCPALAAIHRCTGQHPPGSLTAPATVSSRLRVHCTLICRMKALSLLPHHPLLALLALLGCAGCRTCPSVTAATARTTRCAVQGLQEQQREHSAMQWCGFDLHCCTARPGRRQDGFYLILQKLGGGAAWLFTRLWRRRCWTVWPCKTWQMLLNGQPFSPLPPFLLLLCLTNRLRHVRRRTVPTSRRMSSPTTRALPR